MAKCLRSPVHLAVSIAFCIAGTFVTNIEPAVAVNLEWIRQLGTSAREDNHGVSADGLGNVYVSGYTQGSLQGTNIGARDAFVAKYDSAGSRLWIKQLGSTVDDRGWGVSADSVGNVYLAGTTGGSLQGTNLGSTDAFLTKYDAAGTLLWTRQLGSTVNDDGRNIYADGAGNVYISGFTSGSLQGTNVGLTDAFVSKYNSTGALQWTRQLGTTSTDYSYGVTADAIGNVYISGTTSGSFQGSTHQRRRLCRQVQLRRRPTMDEATWHNDHSRQKLHRFCGYARQCLYLWGDERKFAGDERRRLRRVRRQVRLHWASSLDEAARHFSR